MRKMLFALILVALLTTTAAAFQCVASPGTTYAISRRGVLASIELERIIAPLDGLQKTEFARKLTEKMLANGDVKFFTAGTSFKGIKRVSFEGDAAGTTYFSVELPDSLEVWFVPADSLRRCK